MRYTVKHINLVNNTYVVLNVDDVIVGIDTAAAPDSMVLLRVRKTQRNF